MLLRQPAQSVTLGSQLTLSCHVAGHFTQAYWSRGGRVIRDRLVQSREPDQDILLTPDPIWILSYAVKNQRKARNAPSRRMKVP